MNFDRMNEIIDGVWLGDFSAAVNVENLKKKGIKKILSVMIQFGISENGELDPGPNYIKVKMVLFIKVLIYLMFQVKMLLNILEIV